MSELLDIIISAVDEASATFQSITDSANDMGDQITSSVEGSEGDFDSMASAVDQASGRVVGLGEEVSSVDSSNIGDAASATDEFGQEAENAEGPLSGISEIIGGLAGVEVFSQLSTELMDLADAAGNYNDSMMRASLEAEGAGISAGQMKNVISDLSAETGRAGGQLRESFITATARGITDMGSFKTMMEGAGAQATLFGTDIESMGNKFSKMAMRSTLMERSLSETGITMDELATAMGMSGATADEVKEKWKELDTNQKAAILGQAASMNEGKKANEEYKNSWAGLHEQFDIAKGKLERVVGEVFLPVLIPAIKAAAQVLDWLGGIISSVMNGPLGGFISVIGSVVAVIALAIPAYMAFSAALTFITGPAAAAAVSLWAMVAPLLPFIAIGALIVLIIYEIGKAFGWWTDVGSMIDAISAGLQRLWSAFINHPDVQAALQVIADGFRVLGGWIMEAVKAVLEFFGVNTSGEFDVVAGIIEAIGNAWEMVREPVLAFCDILLTILQVITEVVNGNMDAETAIITIWNALVANLPIILQALFNLWVTIWNAILTAAFNLASRLVTGVVNYIRRLPGRINAYLLQVLARIIAAGTRWVTNAKNKANQLVTRVIAYFHSLPGKAYTQLYAVAGKITSAGQSWINNARTVASKVVTNVMSEINSLPGKVASEFKEIAQRVLNTAGALIKAAKSVASRMVKAALAALQRNSPGIIQRSAVAEFTETIDRVKQQINPAGKVAYAFGKSMVDGFGKSALDLETGNTFDVRTGKYVVSDENMKLDVNNNVKLELDLRNVPKHINTNELKEALTDRNVLKAIVSNNDFQDLDSRVKNKRYLRNKRANGG